MSTEAIKQSTVVVMVIGLFCLAITNLFQDREINAIKTRLALVESNAQETVKLARQVREDADKLHEATMELFRYLTNHARLHDANERAEFYRTNLAVKP